MLRHTLLFLLISQLVIAQNIKAPVVIVLTPLEFQLDESLIADSKELEITMSDEQVAECIESQSAYVERESLKESIKIECNFKRNSNISTVFTHIVYVWIGYRLSNYFENVTTYPKKDQNTREIHDYETLCEKKGINWIVNIKKVNFISELGKLSGEVTFELWNENVKEVVQSKTISVDSRNRGLEMSCEDGKLDCLITNGAIFTATEILETMFSEEKYWR